MSSKPPSSTTAPSGSSSILSPHSSTAPVKVTRSPTPTTSVTLNGLSPPWCHSKCPWNHQPCPCWGILSFKFCTNYRKFQVSSRPSSLGAWHCEECKHQVWNPFLPNGTVGVQRAGGAPIKQILGAAKKRMGNNHWANYPKISTTASKFPSYSFDDFFPNFPRLPFFLPPHIPTYMEYSASIPPNAHWNALLLHHWYHLGNFSSFTHPLESSTQD